MASTNTPSAAAANNSSRTKNSSSTIGFRRSLDSNSHQARTTTRITTAAAAQSTRLIMDHFRSDDNNKKQQKRQKISNNNDNNATTTAESSTTTPVISSIDDFISGFTTTAPTISIPTDDNPIPNDVAILLSGGGAGGENNNNIDYYDNSRKKSRRRNSERYAGWPEELRQSHSLLRRMIRPVVGYRTPTDAEIEAAPNQLVLDLCRKHPALAQEKFLCHNKQVELSPLKFLIHNKANVDVIAGFVQSFPITAQQIDRKNDFFTYLDGTPLHMACTIRPDDGELIAVLARAFPRAVSTPNEGGFLPLHLLLEYRGFTPSLRGLQALIEIDPETSLRKPPSPNNDAFPPVFSILSSNQLTLQHMECIYSRLPRHVIRLDFPTTCFRGNCLSMDHARTIARVLPQIQELNLQPPSWTSDAWMVFVQACQQHATYLRKLALRPPAQLLLPRQQQQQRGGGGAGGGVPSPAVVEVRTALIHFLYGCTALEMLDLQTPNTNTAAGAGAAGPAARLAAGGGRGGGTVPDLTAPIVHLLRNGRLVSLRVMGYNLSSRPIFAALVNNTLLKHLVVQLQQAPVVPVPAPAPPPPDDDSTTTTTNATTTALTLSSVLEHHNVTLQQAQVSYPMNFSTHQVEAGKIRYYTRLNRMGRAAFRDSHQHHPQFHRGASSTLIQMLQILIGAQMDPEIRASHPRECVATLYGLLRESPGLWSRNVMTTTTSSSSISQGATGGAAMNNTGSETAATQRKRKQPRIPA